MLHKTRAREKPEDEEHGEVTHKEFEDTLAMLQKKNKEKYLLILNAGQSLKRAVFRMFKILWSKEEKPTLFEDTVLIQLYKGKGDKSNLNNHRNIHTKKYLPKAFESIIVEKSKDRIVSKCSKFQIGALLGHRAQEHLFVLKSTINLFVYLNEPLIFQCWDISKYFDKESLKDTMDALYQSSPGGRRLIKEQIANWLS